MNSKFEITETEKILLPNSVQATVPICAGIYLWKPWKGCKAYSGLSARDSNPGRPDWEAKLLVRRLFRAEKWHESNCVRSQLL